MGLRRQLGELGQHIDQDERHLADLSMRAAAAGDLTYTTDVRSPSVWRLAKFAYVAEQYGYRYAGLDPDLGSSNTPLFIFRRLPDAGERSRRVRQDYPDALTGGRLPGLRSLGGRLVPTPEARQEVKLLHARIKVDYAAAVGREPLTKWFLGIPAAILLMLVVNGEVDARGLLVGAGLALGLVLLLVASRWFLLVRQKAYQRLLHKESAQQGNRPVR
ncbi:hypothetical protein [Streptomyces lycii]|uniref:Uncharacterized protein n=1 Tax=Streptomyces lycii TaxID=2654337 RepID=A0ABQ7F9A7_9ACTN|nr:hypothetical protein [Streptomyces lycii]KAF4405085.1 hypothetical protein GCU69_32065 [Streptomyces lycii]